MGAPCVLILGHSFIRRLHDFIESDPGHLDFLFHLSASALISWHGIGGCTIANTIKYNLHNLHSFRPDIGIVQLGTNYLTSCSPLQVGSPLEDFLHLLHDSYGVKGVCVCQTIRRRANVDILTRYVRVVLEPIQYAIYSGHRGFWSARNSFFSADGVHLKVGGDISYIAAFGEQYSNLFEFLLAMAICNFFSPLFLSMECYAVLLIPILFVSAFGFLFSSLRFICAQHWLHVSL